MDDIRNLHLIRLIVSFPANLVVGFLVSLAVGPIVGRLDVLSGTLSLALWYLIFRSLLHGLRNGQCRPVCRLALAQGPNLFSLIVAPVIVGFA